MPQVLAVCENGHFFPTYGVEFGGAPYVEVLEAELTVGEDVPVPNCPECGETSRILDGAYNVVGDTLELLQGPERTVSELERLRATLREAQETRASPEEVRKRLSYLPGLGPSLSDLLVPTTPSDFYALLAFVVAVIGVILQAKRSGQNEDSKIEVNQIINDITIRLSPTSPAYGAKIGRNEPCPCESGRKFKQCHGANGETHYYGP